MGSNGTVAQIHVGLYPVAQSYDLLTQAGIGGTDAPVALYGAALLDIGLGTATMVMLALEKD